LKHVEDSNKHITEEIVCQVGYPPELYEDAQSKKYKILNIFCFIPQLILKSFNAVPFTPCDTGPSLW